MDENCTTSPKINALVRRIVKEAECDKVHIQLQKIKFGRNSVKSLKYHAEKETYCLKLIIKCM